MTDPASAIPGTERPVGEGQVSRRHRLLMRLKHVEPIHLLAAMAIVVIVVGAVAALSMLGWPFADDPWGGLPEDPSVTVNLAGFFPAEGEAPLQGPAGIAIDGSRVFVSESEAGRVAIFDVGGSRLGEIVLEVAPGAMRAVPLCLAVGDRDRIAVLDAGADRVLVYDVAGAEAELLFELGDVADGAGPVRPTAVAYDDGEWYLFDADSATIRVYDEDGAFAREIGAGLERAGGMVAVDGRLVMSESGTGRVVSLDAQTGDGMQVLSEGALLPRGIAALKDGVAVADALDGAVRVVSLTGTVTHVIDEASVPDWPPSGPEGVAFHERRQRLYVTDPAFGRVAIFNIR